MFLLDWGKIENVFCVEFYRPIYLQNREKIRKSKYGYSKVKKITLKVTKGETPLWKGEKYQESGIRFIRSENVLENTLNFNNSIYISEEVHKQMKRSQLHQGDILLNIVGASIGRSCIFDLEESANINQAVALIRLKEKYLPEWFSFLLNSNTIQLQIEQLKSGGARDNIDLKQIKAFEIPIHPLEVQKIIVSNLSEAIVNRNNKKNKAQKLLNEIEVFLLTELDIAYQIVSSDIFEDRIFETDFTKTLGNRLDPFYYQSDFEAINKAIMNSKYKDTVTKFRNCLSFIGSGSRPPGGVKNIEEGILSVGGEHVNWLGQVEVKTPKYIPEKFHKNHRLTHTKLNDVLIVKDGATTGKTGIITSPEHIDQNINEHVFLLRFNNLNPHFVTFLLNTSLFQKVIKRQITGATVTGLTKQALKSILIPVPDMDIQNKLVETISQKRKEAFQLIEDAEIEFTKTKKEIEKMILE